MSTPSASNPSPDKDAEKRRDRRLVRLTLTLDEIRSIESAMDHAGEGHRDATPGLMDKIFAALSRAHKIQANDSEHPRES